MPTPFPGMDPYIESWIWGSFHSNLITAIYDRLNPRLPKRFIASTELFVWRVDNSERLLMGGPDVFVSDRDPVPGSGGVATLAAPINTVLPGVVRKQRYVKIIDSEERRVVAVIEILSPSNKAPGPDRDLYTAKRSSIIRSTTSLIEIDLLRAGDRSLFGPELHKSFSESRISRPDYLVLVHRGWRAHRFGGQVYPIPLQQVLPVIGVPLTESEALAPLDLQFAFQEAYDRGPYRRGAVNYDALPDSPLPVGLDSWAKDCIARRRGASVS